MTQQRLKAEQRCAAIRQAIRAVFAEKGFEGTTTRELAKAAGVSEALLYRHFPSKQAMYEAMTQGCLGDRSEAEFKQILALEPSASTLVLLTHFLISEMIFQAKKENRAIDTLVVRSLLGDGEFVRVMYKNRGMALQKQMKDSLLVARKAGDAFEAPTPANLAGWLAKAVGMGMSLFVSPEKPIVDFEVERDRLTEACVWFILLGLGLKPEIVKRHYNPKAFALLAAV